MRNQKATLRSLEGERERERERSMHRSLTQGFHDLAMSGVVMIRNLNVKCRAFHEKSGTTYRYEETTRHTLHIVILVIRYAVSLALAHVRIHPMQPPYY